MRVDAIPFLKVRNLGRIDKYSLYKITVYENEDEEYITFCTPECAKVIDSYLEFRQRHGERIKEDSPLIREEFDINDEIHAARPRHLSYFLFSILIGVSECLISKYSDVIFPSVSNSILC
jgi:hypothetical protein